MLRFHSTFSQKGFEIFLHTDAISILTGSIDIQTYRSTYDFGKHINNISKGLRIHNKKKPLKIRSFFYI